MDFSNYLLDKKAPYGRNAELGRLDGEIGGIYDLSQVPEDKVVLSLISPLKKFKLKYTNWEYLEERKNIEAIYITNLDEARINILSKLPKLKYLQISTNKQEVLPSLKKLKHLEVLILSGIRKVQNLEFLAGLPNLKTLYIHGFKNLTDLSPLSTLKTLKELDINLYLMSGGYSGGNIKSIEPISNLKNLEYLSLYFKMENNNYDCSYLINLKKLKVLYLKGTFLKKGQDVMLRGNLPHLRKNDSNIF